MCVQRGTSQSLRPRDPAVEGQHLAEGEVPTN